MRFQFRPSREEVARLRIVAGDVVICNGEFFRVLAAGLKYARLESMTGHPKGLARLTDLRRADVAAEDKSPLDELPGEGYGNFDRDSLTPKRR